MAAGINAHPFAFNFVNEQNAYEHSIQKWFREIYICIWQEGMKWSKKDEARPRLKLIAWLNFNVF